MKTLTVIKFFGGDRGAQAKIARELQISTAAVAKWPKDGDVPGSSLGSLFLKFPELYRMELEKQSTSTTTTPAATSATGEIQ
ncbi:hypothetical protein [Silvimonas soli]|uniref:hypothetical protein n=1 Tax=Silvimonas soli TaxID=2980100 RepID=UPI0024B3ACDA|nr:hypothetical protein [Silvimonas soli]